MQDEGKKKSNGRECQAVVFFVIKGRKPANNAGYDMKYSDTGQQQEEIGAGGSGIFGVGQKNFRQGEAGTDQKRRPEKSSCGNGSEDDR